MLVKVTSSQKQLIEAGQLSLIDKSQYFLGTHHLTYTALFISLLLHGLEHEHTFVH